jgi:hypothetical protein
MSLPDVGYPLKKRLLIALVILVVCAIAVFAPRAGARSFAPAAAPIPNPPLAVWMTVDASSHADNVFGVTLWAQSATDMPVPYVKVVVTTCQFCQQTSFQLAYHARHLNPKYETLIPFNGGRSLWWYMFSAPANTAQPAKLTLDFALPYGHGGPTFCVSASGYTDVSPFWTLPVSITWPLK